jgi:hypothetical protein
MAKKKTKKSWHVFSVQNTNALATYAVRAKSYDRAVEKLGKVVSLPANTEVTPSSKEKQGVWLIQNMVKQPDGNSLTEKVVQ